MSAVRGDDPPIKLWINQDGYFERGDRARVHVKLDREGYLIVLRADTRGRVRVLFPRDPGDDARVRGGRKFEVLGRGDREAFSVDDPEGTGLVLAARAARAPNVADFVRGDHWDYRALAAPDTAAPLDPEAALLDIVHRMVPDGRFDYDIVRYSIEDGRAYHGRRHHPRYSPVRFRLGVGYGRPFYRYGFYGSCYDPFWRDPFFCSAYYDPFFYGPVFYRRSFYRSSFYFFPQRSTRFTFKERPAAGSSVIGPRFRIPEGRLRR